MFNKNLKLVLAVLIVIIAIWQFSEENIGNGIMYVLFSLVFIFLYFKNEIMSVSENPYIIFVILLIWLSYSIFTNNKNKNA